MFVSGFLYGFSDTEIFSWPKYYAFVVKKFKRLMIPYFVVSLIVLVLKYIAGKYFPLVRPVDSDFWIYIFFNPSGGYASFLWFLYVLFIIFAIFPLLKYFSKNAYVLFLVALVIYFYPIGHNVYFNIDSVNYYLIFFYIGYLYSQTDFRKINIYAKYLCPLLFALSIICFINRDYSIYYVNQFMPFRYSKNLVNLLMGTLGLFSLYYMSVLITNGKKHIFRLFHYIGVFSAAIYMLHTIFMSPVKILMIEYLNYGRNSYTLISILSILSGIIFPIFTARYFINRYKILSFLILGVSMNVSRK